MTASGAPLRLAYADPPYPGLARRYYDCPEVDHGALIESLAAYDGWALSTSAAALPDVLRLCPSGARVAIWNHGGRPRSTVGPRNAYEPVILFGGRVGLYDVDDVLHWSGRQHSHPEALIGMKPAAFCEWVFRLMGAAAGDSLADLFPGSGAVGRAWALFTGPGSAGESRLAESVRRRDATRRGDQADASRAAERDGSASRRVVLEDGYASRPARGHVATSSATRRQVLDEA